MARTTEKLPALPWYPKDYLADEHVIAMSLEAEGAYRRLLDHQWLHGSIPADVRLQAGICKKVSVPRMRRIWEQVGSLFVPMPLDVTRLQNAKLERVRQEREEFIERKREAGRRGAAVTNGSADGRHIRRQEVGTADKVPSAKGRPASASASATASATESPPPHPAVAIASWARLHTKLPATGIYRGQVGEFLSTVPEHSLAGWVAKIEMALEGVGSPGGKAVTPDELLQALAQASAGKSREELDPRFFDAVLRTVVAKRYAKPDTAPDAPAGKRLPRLTPDLEPTA